MFVKLQRPPPEIRIFLPIRSARSITPTRLPRLPASIAHISPAAPAPRISTSNLWVMRWPWFDRSFKIVAGNDDCTLFFRKETIQLSGRRTNSNEGRYATLLLDGDFGRNQVT